MHNQYCILHFEAAVPMLGELFVRSAIFCCVFSSATLPSGQAGLKWLVRYRKIGAPKRNDNQSMLISKPMLNRLLHHAVERDLVWNDWYGLLGLAGPRLLDVWLTTLKHMLRNACLVLTATGRRMCKGSR